MIVKTNVKNQKEESMNEFDEIRIALIIFAILFGLGCVGIGWCLAKLNQREESK
jgi:hypothetical protein